MRPVLLRSSRRPARPPRKPVLALAIAIAAAGCAAAPPAKMSFAEAGLAGAPQTPAAVAHAGTADDAPDDVASEGELPPPVSIPAPRSIASELPDGPPIDAVLLRFSTDARSRRAALPAAASFPPEVTLAWDALLADLDGYLGRALPQTPLLELIRTRVTVEAEWDFDRRRFGAPPAALAEAVQGRSARLATRVDVARALGFALVARPAPARLRWPVEDAGISSPFGPRIDPLTGERRMHQGLDLAADEGRVVSAAAGGWVVRAGFAGGHGLLVEVRHPGDVTTRYSHLSALLCGPGDPVDPGQPLGLVGRTGRATGPHLHFEVWKGGEPQDPLGWLGLAPRDAVAGDGTRARTTRAAVR